MKTYVISDLHFGHANVMLYEPIRVRALAQHLAARSDSEGVEAIENRLFEMLNGSNETKRSVVDQFDQLLIDRWNSVVIDDDLVYILGDFTLSRKPEIIASYTSALKGRKVLVMGNHDTAKPLVYLKNGFIQAVRKPILYTPRVVLMHEPPQAENIINGMKFLYGHVHSKIYCDAAQYDNCGCVCCEVLNFYPADMEQFIKQLK